MGGAWPAMSDEAPSAKGEHSKRERLTAKARQASRLDRTRDEGTVAFGGYRGRMGGDYTHLEKGEPAKKIKLVDLLKPP